MWYKRISSHVLLKIVLIKFCIQLRLIYTYTSVFPPIVIHSVYLGNWKSMTKYFQKDSCKRAFERSSLPSEELLRVPDEFNRKSDINKTEDAREIE